MSEEDHAIIEGLDLRRQAMTLAEFLLARIGEDEARWRGQPWLLPHAAECSHLDVARGWCDCGLPGRLVSRCEADRRIVDICSNVLRSFDREVGAMWSDVNRRERHHASETLYALAAVYADHPDYRDEWRP